MHSLHTRSLSLSGGIGTAPTGAYTAQARLIRLAARLVEQACYKAGVYDTWGLQSDCWNVAG